VGWARERDSRSELVRIATTDGEAVFFDGRLWHGTHNVSRRTRRALLLQYAAPESSIRVPDLSYPDWPFRQLDSPHPPCLIVRGSARVGSNRVVPAPLANGQVRDELELTSRIHVFRLPLEPDEEVGWKPYPAFKLQAHVTVLEPGEGYDPHVDSYDVAVVVLEGEVETIGGRAAAYDVIFHRAGEPHGMRNVGTEAARYVVFEFHGRTSLASGAPGRVRATLEELVTRRHWTRRLKSILGR
jgi:quercetin dioxygenase-like cupin family protein